MPATPDSATPFNAPNSLQNPAIAENHFPQLHTPSASSTSTLSSCGELERTVGQALQKAYRQHLGHLPTRVSCHLFANQLSVWIENSLTPVETILLSNSPSTVKSAPQKIRFAIDRAMQQRLSPVIEDCLEVSVITLISGTCYEQNCTSLTALLSETPAVRNPEKIPKTTANRQAHRKPAVKEATDS